jgi:hypothetical protein
MANSTKTGLAAFLLTGLLVAGGCSLRKSPPQPISQPAGVAGPPPPPPTGAVASGGGSAVAERRGGKKSAKRKSSGRPKAAAAPEAGAVGAGRSPASDGLAPIAERHSEIDLLRVIDEQWDKLPLASGTLRVPTGMEKDPAEPYQMELAISVKKDIAAIHQDIERWFGEGAGETFDQRGIRVSSSLKAEAASTAAFQIDPMTPTETFLADGDAAWKWRVTPRLEGDHKIDVVLSVKILQSGSWRYVTTYAQTVTVHVGVEARVRDWLKEHWEWAWTALVLPTGAYVVGRWRKRRKRESPAAVEPRFG